MCKQEHCIKKMPMQSGSTRNGVAVGMWVVSVWVYLVTQGLAAGSNIPYEIVQVCGTSRTSTADFHKVLLFFHPNDIPSSSQCVCFFSPAAANATNYSVQQFLGDRGIRIDTGIREGNAPGPAGPVSNTNTSSNASLISSSSSTSSMPSSALSSSTSSTPIVITDSTTTAAAVVSSSSTIDGNAETITAATTLSGNNNTTASNAASSPTHGSPDNGSVSSTPTTTPATTNSDNNATNVTAGDGEALKISFEGGQASSLVGVVVKANNLVNISCKEVQPASSPSPSQDRETSPGNEASVVTALSTSSATASPLSTTTTDNVKVTLARGQIKDSGTGKADKPDEDDNGQSQLMFSLSCALLVVAVVIAVPAGWCFFSARRQRRKRADGQAESGPDKKRQRGNKASSSNGATASGAGLNNSRVSLISEGHNYEDMREEDDAEASLRKGSNFSVASTASQHQNHQQRKKHSHPQPDNYSHIPSSRRPAPPTADGNDDYSDDSNDDYNRLNLSSPVPKDACSKKTPNTASSPSSSSAPQTATTSSAAAPKSFYIGDVDNEYTEVRDEGDIYEAVDEPVPEDIYTDCVSSSPKEGGDGSSGGKVNPAFDRRGLREPGGREGPVVPPLPAAPLPALVAAKGLRRYKSRSVDMSKVEALRYKTAAAAAASGGEGGREERGDRRSAGDGESGGWKGHKQSKSVDLNCSSGTNSFLCQQRDLFLEKFKKQQAAEGGGDGGGSGGAGESGGGAGVAVRGLQCAATQRPRASAEYTDICVARGAGGISIPPPPISSRPAAALAPAPTPDAAPRSSPAQSNKIETINGAANSNTSAAPPPTNSGAAASSEGAAAEPVVALRRKTQRHSSKKKVNPDAPPSIVDHLKETNTQLLQVATAVRRSMEIHADEFIMIDNAIYGTLPRNHSLPTTEL